MNKVLSNLVHLIAAAQTHSDEGKVDRNFRRAHRDWEYCETQEVLEFNGTPSKRGYAGKDSCIMAAIKTIDSHPYINCSYYIKDNSDNAIVYFNITADGKKYQVSFHTFNKEIMSLCGKGSPCRWKKEIGSRETCQILLQIICGKESEILCL